MSSGVTVCLTVDYDAVSVWRMHGAVGARGLSRGEFGVTEGAPRLLESLERHGVTAIRFVPGITARQYPKSVAGVATAGHEIANHGYFHEDFAAPHPTTPARRYAGGMRPSQRSPVSGRSARVCRAETSMA